MVRVESEVPASDVTVGGGIDRRGRWPAAVGLLFVAALAGYVLLRQRSYYASDGFFLEDSLRSGACTNTSHEAFLPILLGFARATAWLHLSPHETITALSACGGALGVVFTCLGLRLLGVDRPRALAAATAVAATPAVVFFATAVEYHGCFFAASQLAFVAAAWHARQPTAWRAVVLGLAMAGAGLVHATGWFLPLVLLPLASNFGARRAARPLLLAGVVAVAATVLAVAAARASGIGERPPVTLEFLADHAAEVAARLRFVPHVLVWEWLLPLLPLSLAGTACLLHAHARAAGAVAAAAALAYAVPVALILTDELWERGAYLLPCVTPLALACARALRPLQLLALALAGGALGVAGVRDHDRLGETYAAVVDGACACAAGLRPLLLVAERIERGACLVFADRVDHVWGGAFATQPAATVAAGGPALEAYLLDAERRGRQVLVSNRALAALDDSPGGRAAIGQLRARRRFETIAAAGFSGYRLSR